MSHAFRMLTVVRFLIPVLRITLVCPTTLARKTRGATVLMIFVSATSSWLRVLLVVQSWRATVLVVLVSISPTWKVTVPLSKPRHTFGAVGKCRDDPKRADKQYTSYASGNSLQRIDLTPSHLHHALCPSA